MSESRLNALCTLIRGLIDHSKYSMEFDVAHWLSILVKNDDSYRFTSLVSDPNSDGMVPES